jgi:hypothetical protein
MTYIEEKFPGCLILPIENFKVFHQALVAEIKPAKPFTPRSFRKAMTHSCGYPLYLERSGEFLGRFTLTSPGTNAYRIHGHVPSIQRTLSDSQADLHLFWKPAKTQDEGRVITEVRVEGASLSADLGLNDEPSIAAVAVDLVKAHRACRSSLVYFVKTRFSSTVKIGMTKALSKRLKALQTGASEPIDVVAVVPGPPELERSLHKIFDQYRLAGEWFAYGRAIELFLCQLQQDVQKGRA